MLTTGGLGAPGLAGWLLVPLLLLVIRPVLVAATAGREFMDRRSVLFLGFFGVRGVAALFYAAVVDGAGVLRAPSSASSCGRRSSASSPRSSSTGSRRSR